MENTKQNELTVKKVAVGYYELAKNGLTGRIFRFDEGSWNGWWMLDWSDGSYADPFRTKRDAVLAARQWGNIENA